MGHPLDGRAWTFPIAFEELPVGRQLAFGPVVVRSFETITHPTRCRTAS